VKEGLVQPLQLGSARHQPRRSWRIIWTTVATIYVFAIMILSIIRDDLVKDSVLQTLQLGAPRPGPRSSRRRKTRLRIIWGIVTMITAFGIMLLLISR
jgi:hypothetical protein